ncbi:hypothetical protein [Sedimentibacter sp. B4]|uniref:hypothetical protein n=1 Tax=Sedimentibacter sp. B4 TaxID=304766 RepID=UPI00058E31E0|nr:hypothetical protein [Sedimentibacter sp. B4]
MTFTTTFSIFLILSALIISIIVSALQRGTSGVKIMLLGINTTLFGGIFAVDSHINLAGVEYLISLFGFIICFIGFLKKE